MKPPAFLTKYIDEHRALIDTIGRFIAVGSVGAVTNIGLLFLLTEYIGLYYLVSAGISFILACGVGFVLQKFWTFREHSTESVHVQAVGYFTISTINFFLNTALLYFLVEKTHVWYILAQIISSGFIAISSFLLYRNVVFFVKK